MRGRSIILGIVCLCIVGVWAGCSEEKNYRTLSFFFDGVPLPPGMQPPEGAGTPGAKGGPGVKGTAKATFIHKPYGDGNCNGCHSSRDPVASMPTGEACNACHKDVKTNRPVMHGAVVAGACLWCHTPHESAYAHLMRASAYEVCSQCHEKELLPATPREHQESGSDCLSCHFGHGGTARKFLRPKPTTTTAPVPGVTK